MFIYFIYRLAKLLNLYSRVLNIYNRELRGHFTLKAHVILVTGDGPAIADVIGTKSPSKLKQSCRLCPLTGTQGRGGKYYYLNNRALQPALHTDMQEQIKGLKHYCTTTSN